MFQFIIFVVISVAIGVFLQQTSPDISFTYNSLLIKIPTWKVIAVILIITVIQKWLLKIAFTNWLKNRTLNKSLKQIRKTFFCLLEGNIENAESCALKIKNIDPNSQFNWLKSLFSLMKSELYYNQNNYEYALIELNKLYKQSPNKKLILLRLSSIYDSLNNWPELLKLLATLKKNKIYNSSDYQQLELKVYTENLKQIANTENIDLALNFFKQAPKTLKSQSRFILSFVNCLVQGKYYDLTENTIKNYINNNLDNLGIHDTNALIKIYGLIKSSNIKQQIKYAEQWNYKHPNNVTLLLTLGRLCINEGLWGKAKNYLEQAITIEPDPDCYKELGRLADLLGETDKSIKFYQKSLNTYENFFNS